jgi:hypothetical protein
MMVVIKYTERESKSTEKRQLLGNKILEHVKEWFLKPIW